LILLNALVHRLADAVLMQRFPPTNGPRFELLSVGQTLDDLDPGDDTMPSLGLLPLIWSAAASLALIAFMGWLLVS